MGPSQNNSKEELEALKNLDAKETPKPKEPKYSIEHLFEAYLRMVKLDKRKMPPFQLREIRRAFYGASGQLLILQAEKLAQLMPGEAEQILHELIDEVGQFWKAQNE